MHPDELLSSYDYHLPKEQIAQHPLAERSASRLMVLHRAGSGVEHRRFHEFPKLLEQGDLLVLNETSVIPARLEGVRAATGGRWEGLFLGVTATGDWRLMGQTRGKLQPGEEISLHPVHVASVRDRREEQVAPTGSFGLTLVEKESDGVWQARPVVHTDPLAVLQQFGSVPLPPYIAREKAGTDDFERYQTTYARTPGAVAAPTAGLHFTPAIFEQCRERGIATVAVTLHVGVGTFRPISVERLSEHEMHSEWCEVPQGAAEAIERTRRRGGRIVAVGTTTVRTLESVAAAHEGRVAPWSGETRLFIRPPYAFRVVDALVTNFHLPKSSLLVMLSALAGRERILQAYANAVAAGYRFFSYGDAMLVL